nr:cyclic nucleotide-binding domain-containing protein [Acanthopleuribacter pedis]
MRDYEPGEFLMRQGDPGGEMFLLSEGRVAVEIEQDGDLVKVAELGEGDFVGEASLLTGAPRNASVRADEPTTCLILSDADLKQLTKDHPSVMESIKSIYYTRVSQNASRFSRQEQTQA